MPWIEPLINCLHQESVLSLLVGNLLFAIMSMFALLEYVLGLALVNKNDCGYDCTESIEEIDKCTSLTNIVNEVKDNDVFKGCDYDWWLQVAKNIRNKSAHYLLLLLMRQCADKEYLPKYINEYDLMIK